MEINLPQDLITRVQRVAALQGATEADVIRRAMDSLDWMEKERQAVQEGIDAWHSGDVQDFESFDRDFRKKNGIRPDA